MNKFCEIDLNNLGMYVIIIMHDHKGLIGLNGKGSIKNGKEQEKLKEEKK